MGSVQMDPHHVHSFWGLSHALDLKYLSSAARTLQAALTEGASIKTNDATVLNILQVAPSDPRHSITTLAKSWRRQPNREVRTLVWEPSVEGLARHMLLFSIMMDTKLTMRDRMQIFVEVYGNIKIREKTAEYIEEQGKILASVVLDSNMGEADGPFNKLFDFSNLKFKEKDELVDVLRSYTRKVDYHMDAAWEWRCRKFYGDRYEYIRNLVDWDYHMRLIKFDPRAEIVHFQQWREWRSTGIAFDIRDSRFIEPNRTLLSTATGRTIEFRDRLGAEKGRSVTTRGLYTDMLSSPYLAFGVDCHEKFLFRKSNKMHIKTAVDITQFNIENLIQELYHQEERKYIPTPEEAHKFQEEDRIKANNKGEDVDSEVPEPKQPTPSTEDDATNSKGDEEDEDEAARLAGLRALAQMGKLKIALVTGDLEKNVFKKNANKEAFDVVTLGNTMTHRVKDGLHLLAKPGAILAMEDARFMMNLNMDQVEEFQTRMDVLAQEWGWELLGESIVGLTPEHHIFTRKSGSHTQ
eukprot:CAMPEP_0114260650 /NCGR_PEP_ID=MMETSP0058-20121206/20620_1 /TAXON_ID=36894 /ORGANISM="Pyramimonas parkeae, CCMP726" /LENGTH=521 /DNA_ID=CAMNT_0001375939 /DNA_START=100 /DNA_END=1665 /DNA_ORIENTATION=+